MYFNYYFIWILSYEMCKYFYFNNINNEWDEIIFTTLCSKTQSTDSGFYCNLYLIYPLQLKSISEIFSPILLLLYLDFQIIDYLLQDQNQNWKAYQRFIWTANRSHWVLLQFVQLPEQQQTTLSEAHFAAQRSFQCRNVEM